MHFKEFILKKIEESDLKQISIAMKLNLSTQAWSIWKKQNKNISVERFLQICEACKLSPMALIKEYLDAENIQVSGVMEPALPYASASDLCTKQLAVKDQQIFELLEIIRKLQKDLK